MTPKISFNGKDTLFCFNNRQANILRTELLNSKRKDTLITLQNYKMQSLERETKGWENTNKALNSQLETCKSVEILKNAQIIELQKQVNVYKSQNKRNRLRQMLHKSVNVLLGGVIVFLLLQ